MSTMTSISCQWKPGGIQWVLCAILPADAGANPTPVAPPLSPGTCETLSTTLGYKFPFYLKDVNICVFLIGEVDGWL